MMTIKELLKWLNEEIKKDTTTLQNRNNLDYNEILDLEYRVSNFKEVKGAIEGKWLIQNQRLKNSMSLA